MLLSPLMVAFLRKNAAVAPWLELVRGDPLVRAARLVRLLPS